MALPIFSSERFAFTRKSWRYCCGGVGKVFIMRSMLRLCNFVKSLYAKGIYPIDNVFRMRNNGYMSKMKTNLVWLMQSAGHKAYDVARKTGIHQTTIYRFLQNPHGELKSETVQKLAWLYGVTEGQLRGYTPIEGMQMPQEVIELEEHLSTDECHLIANMRNLSDDARGIICRLTEILAVAEPEAAYHNEFRDRRRQNISPNRQLRRGESRYQAALLSKRRVKDPLDNARKYQRSSKSSQLA